MSSTVRDLQKANEAIKEKDAEIERLNSERKEIIAVLGDAHPPVVALKLLEAAVREKDAEIEKMKADIETADAAHTKADDASDALKEALDRVAQQDDEITNLHRTVSEKNAAIEQAQADLREANRLLRSYVTAPGAEPVHPDQGNLAFGTAGLPKLDAMKPLAPQPIGLAAGATSAQDDVQEHIRRKREFNQQVTRMSVDPAEVDKKTNEETRVVPAKLVPVTADGERVQNDRPIEMGGAPRIPLDKTGGA